MAKVNYSELLQSKSKDLRASMSVQSAAQVVTRTERPSDEGDMSQQSNEEWIFLNRNRLESKLLREVEEALSRVGTEDYGVCQECGEEISAKRLAAVPWAKYCVTCQDLVSARRARGDEEESDDGKVT
jgi:DnaK suppressor protein